MRDENGEEQRGQIKQDLMHSVRRIDETKGRQTGACKPNLGCHWFLSNPGVENCFHCLNYLLSFYKSAYIMSSTFCRSAKPKDSLAGL